MSSPRPEVSLPEVPGGVFRLPPDSVIVEDADEEIMELYMNLESTASTSTNSGGLGFLNANHVEMELNLEIVPPAVVADEPRARVKGRRKEKEKKKESISVDVRVVQDPSALRARSGDTGSVLWRSSLHLAGHLLSQNYFPPPAPLLSLSTLNVLELGAGTGVLAALLGPLCQRYVATDRPENCRLVEKNVDANKSAVKGGPPASVVPLDWMDISEARKRAAAKGATYVAPEAQGTDLVLAVDCIYNEHLVAPLVDALAATCANGAIAWVVVELRSADVLTLFLDTWLNDKAGWTIVRLGEDAMGTWEGARGRWVGWVGWCAGRSEV